MVVDSGEVVRNYLATDPGHSVSTTLTAEAAADASSFSLTDGSSFSSKVPVVILIGSELFLGSVSGNTLTLIGWRGAFGTTAAVHGNGSAVHEAVLYDAVEDRIWVPSAQENYKNTQPALVIQPFDRGPVRVPVLRSNMLIKCYPGSGSHQEARALFRLLYDRLHDKEADVTGGGIMHAFLTSAQPAGPDDREGWLRHIAQFEVTVT